MAAWGGGFPIKVNGELVGAIGGERRAHRVVQRAKDLDNAQAGSDVPDIRPLGLLEDDLAHSLGSQTGDRGFRSPN
jgi:hypothetical protein